MFRRRDVLKGSSAGLLTVVATPSFAEADQSTPLMTLDSVHNRPGEALTTSVFRDPMNLAKLGFDAQVENDHRYVQTGVTLESYDPRIIPAGSPEREWVDERARAIDAYVSRCHEAGIAAYIFTDMIVLPKSVRTLFGDEVEGSDGAYDLLKPRVQEIHRALFREIGERFPKLDGIFVRTGEVYLDDVPFHDGNNPMRTHAQQATVEEARQIHGTLIALLREELCERFGKHVVYRTWAFGGIHQDPAVYLAVTDPVPPHPKLTFSIKHTEADFHRQQPFNRTLGIGNHPQIVEVQCQREYEGKGAFPNYIVQGVIEGFEELPADRPKGLRDLVGNPRLAGVWTWSRGGGWRGPYIKNELWCELNAMVMQRWAKSPQRSEHEIFDEFVLERFGLDRASAERFRALCLLSARGVLLGKLSKFISVDEFWYRDEFMTGVVADEIAASAGPFSTTLNRTFNAILDADLTGSILAEKQRAQDIWHQIEALSTTITMADASDTHYLQTSSRYGRILHDIIASAWTAMLLGHARVDDDELNIRRIGTALRQYDAAWLELEALTATRNDCASPFRPYAFRFTPPDYVQPWGLKSAMDAVRKRLR